MPQIINFTPEWLSKPNPGYNIFVGKSIDSQFSYMTALNGSNSSIKRITKPSARRCLAHRGTEIFVAVGKEIRWADLASVKDLWDSKDSLQKLICDKRMNNPVETWDSNSQLQVYRILKTPVAEDIRQLVISPLGDYMAILTTHTIHIAILPESSQLNGLDSDPLKIKCYTLGPITHVTSQAGIVTALWHPLGVNGTCVVTVTEDAIIRVWELSIGSHGSFDQPTLEIDLKKLADGTSADQDFRASSPGINKTFSPDSFEMQVASACFANSDSGGWSPMTLWIAMRAGDVYALCPLLPDRWSPTPNLISSLSVSVVAKIATIEEDQMISQEKKDLAGQQLAWMSEIDNQEPYIVQTPGGSNIEVFTRPLQPGKIPKLQGPFDIELAPEESANEIDDLLSDIYVIGRLVKPQDLIFEEDDDLDIERADSEGPSIDIVCLLTSSGRLSICLDLDGVEAQWLSKSRTRIWKQMTQAEIPSLLTFEVMDLLRDNEVWEGNWPSFSVDLNSRHSFFVTSTSTINFIDISPWVFRLGAELDNDAAGSDFRIDILARSRESTRERLFSREQMNTLAPLSASITMQTPDLGFFLLAASNDGPVAINFESPESALELQQSSFQSPIYDKEDSERLPLIYEPRPVFEPSSISSKNSRVPAFLEKIRHSKFKRLLKEEVRLSPAMLTIMTEAHKLLSDETHETGIRAAELFRRCEQLQIDLISHIKKVHEISTRISAVVGYDYEDKSKKSRQKFLEQRFKATFQRQKNLTYRIERLRRKVVKGTSLPLSEREKSWAKEVQTLETKVMWPEEENPPIITKEPIHRYTEICNLTDILSEQVKDLTDIQEFPSPKITSQLRVPTEIKRQKFEMVQIALDRESALVEATKERLKNLTMAL
ncbi:Nucleoporin [Erysiphe necator]|nr:Nucleoporin [Erysiphe necator]